MSFQMKQARILFFIVLTVVGLTVGIQKNGTSECRFCWQKPAPKPTRAVAYSQPVYVNRPVARGVVVPTQVRYARPVQPIVYRPMPQYVSYRPAQQYVSYRPAQASAYETVAQTEIREEKITTYETVWEEETRVRQRTVTRQVPETSVQTEVVKVSRPVWETVERENAYDVVRYVQETSERQEIQTVSRPVTQMQQREIVETVQRPVTETVVQQRQYTVSRPVTTYQTQLQDQGRYVNQVNPEPGKSYTKLTWQKGGSYYNPETGKSERRLPGLRWTELQGPTQYKEQKVYQQNLVETQVPVTTFVNEVVTEDVPVTTTSMRPEQIVRTEQVPVTTYVQEQIVKKIPTTTYKPVTERVVEKIPVRVCRMQTEEEVREKPVTTYKTVTEVIEEPYTVKVAKIVPKVTVVQRPITVYRQIPKVSPCANTILPPATTESPAAEVPSTFAPGSTAPSAAPTAAPTAAPSTAPIPSSSDTAAPSYQSNRLVTNIRPDMPVLPGPGVEITKTVITTEDSQETEICEPEAQDSGKPSATSFSAVPSTLTETTQIDSDAEPSQTAAAPQPSQTAAAPQPSQTATVPQPSQTAASASGENAPLPNETSNSNVSDTEKLLSATADQRPELVTNPPTK